ncbi:MAG: Molybdopterin synthase sulfur carrier subunit [Alphaproteobacteria bacterium MarineAlpha2_Bin1]|nr:MAG: Molybdopterin synthase sulfur carrier subunit [Alphaproteobacteria bacterium MarineAlpha2_Bin1]|tara:strand:- start:1104 stop:1355 length:252 start_codon:yes stop_codon:yes gene_type:complete
MKVVYFAWVRERVGINYEIIELPEDIKSIETLLSFLSLKSPAHKDALSNRKLLKFSVNFEFVEITQRIKNDDEVAIFPPVTGG